MRKKKEEKKRKNGVGQDLILKEERKLVFSGYTYLNR